MTDDYEIREKNIGGVEKWLWPVSDSGLWDGPRENWNTSHKDKLKKYVTNFNVVVQAGGGCGMYPRLLSDMFKVVYTFEPNYTNFHCLVVNCTKPNIIKINAALGATSGLISMVSSNPKNMGTGRVEEKPDSFIPRLTIDMIKYSHCDLIWLDIEGYEENALKGAMETIHKFKPIIMAEHGQKFEDWMKQLGYEKIDQSVSDAIFRPRPV